MDEQVIGLGVIVIGLIVSYQVSAVMVIVECIGVMTGVADKVGVIVRIVEGYAVYVFEIIVHIDYLETSEFIACRKDKVTAMVVGEPGAGVIGGLGIEYCVVKTAVLHYHGVDLAVGIGYVQAVQTDRHVNLLM